MTPDEFFELLKKTGKYKLWPIDQSIRRCSDGACPILAVFHDNFDPTYRFQNEDVGIVSKKMGLSKEFSIDVVDAADNHPIVAPWRTNVGDVRQKLLSLVC